MEGRPPKVRVLAEAGLISPPPDVRAMLAAPMVSGSVPNSFERTMRTVGPPREMWTISRKVVSVLPICRLPAASVRLAAA